MAIVINSRFLKGEVCRANYGLAKVVKTVIRMASNVIVPLLSF